MKLNTTDFLRKSQFPLIIVLGMLPVFVLIVLHNTPEALPALAPLLPAYVLLSWLCMLLPGRIRIPAGLMSCAALMLLSLRLLPIMQGVSAVDASTVRVSQSAFLLLVPLLLCALLVYSLQFAAWPRGQEITFNWYAIGVVAHLLVQLVSHANRRSGSPAWVSASPLLLVSFILFLALVLLSMNRTTMASASLGRQSVPASMRRKNVVISLATLGAALLIAAIPAIARFVERFFSLFLGAVGAVMAFIARLLESEAIPGTGAPGGGAGLMPYVEYQEPSLLAVILEKIAAVLALAAFALLLLFVLRAVIRNARALIRRLLKRLTQYMAVASQDYVDEITDTREDGGESASSLLERLRRRMAIVNERRLSPNERVRYRYRLLLRKHPDWHRSRTARENLSGQTASLYEQARYSGREVSPQDAERFASDIKNA